MPAVNGVGEPCAGEPHARIEVAAGGIWRRVQHAETALAPPADPTRTAPTSLLTCDDGEEGPHLLVIALVEGSACIVAGQQRCRVAFDNFVRLLLKYRG